MVSVIFIAPYFLAATLRFLSALADTPDVRVALVSTDPWERLPAALRARLVAHWRVADCLDPRQLEEAVRALAARLGPPERLIATLEELQVPVAEVRERLGIAGMGSREARNFRDKARMKSVLREAGLPCARHQLASSAGEVASFASQVGYPVVIKPQAGAGARNTFRVDDDRRLREYLEALPPTAEKPVVIEEFVSGDEHSFDAVLVDGRPTWHSISRYFPTPLDVLQNPWIQWCVLLPRRIDGPEYDDIREAGFGALQALGLRTGLAHVEWFRRPDGRVAISEAGARPPGAQFTTLMSYAHDTDLYRAWAQLVTHDRFPAPERRYATGAAYLRGQGQGHVRAIHGLDRAQAEMGPLVVETRLPEADQSPSGSYEGDGYVILRHPETEVVERALARLVTLVRVELG